MLKKLKRLRTYVSRRFDIWLYGICSHFVNRIVESDRGYAYLTYLNFQRWLQENPPSDEEIERATKVFDKAMGVSSGEVEMPNPPQILWLKGSDERKVHVANRFPMRAPRSEGSRL